VQVLRLQPDRSYARQAHAVGETDLQVSEPFPLALRPAMLCP
jgi:hypothetical protein